MSYWYYATAIVVTILVIGKIVYNVRVRSVDRAYSEFLNGSEK